ncbi:uncharacterized protein LOC18442357 isoform X2 [Amborella trichopoda]|uniref:uncharacterized protein LOC18442357 isoform X2 n=1 Tax=Amborella trichopoda TaxID=13333 RepID=UPI0005D3441E|nr:uncharacterized protein LOC18442357 isoform X2 [Amborella trichopoda]XP_011626309.1 uncharacterized protein LOC18442357 isoform X2 [Amborella trichopoda]|eukprot:XP_011626308.1 uncharacterized protein LOC18442357 isoform X2 [Amborella trichopoda]
MESIAVKPIYRATQLKKPRPSSTFSPYKSPTHFKFHHSLSSKWKNLVFLSSLSNPHKEAIERQCTCMDFPSLSPFCVLIPVLHRITDYFTVKGFHGGKTLRTTMVKWVSGVKNGGRTGACLDDDLLNSGGIGMALLSTTAMAKGHISPVMATLSANPTFMSGLFAWVIAQSTKVLLNFFVERKWDFQMLVSSGGMPSSHSALCTALTTSVALCHGISDALFPVCLGFSLIVMYDATGVRRHAGMQAEVLNMIIEDLFQGHPVSQRKLKELLGHTPSQVIAGAFLGILVACMCCQGCLVAI